MVEPRLSPVRALGDEWSSVSSAAKLKGCYFAVLLEIPIKLIIRRKIFALFNASRKTLKCVYMYHAIYHIGQTHLSECVT